MKMAVLSTVMLITWARVLLNYSHKKVFVFFTVLRGIYI